MGLKRTAAGLAVVVGGVVGLSLISRGCQAFLKSDGATVQAYYHAIGSGDTAKACGLLGDAGRAKLQAERQEPTCEDAVRSLTASLDQAKRDQLVNGEITVNDSASTFSRKEITLTDGDVLGYVVIVLEVHNGREAITDWGRESQQIFSGG
ncbi:hypothetical protein F0L68_00080 [Solihabitans fulvus]|uniref:Uncharacterized protein n=1 Tax=Solihabitans fulvus TaxID=1892852 RepID=A0A5B2XUY9_9PSEU|nr:hypothetical protein [Solihabitans fulvus]KAA2266975.1 hypothetical protein F0L68_00080 [Solihabitans fulvus]